MTTPAASLPRTLIDVLPSPAHEVGRLARDGVLVAGFAVLTALFAQIRIDLGFTPVPITGQTFAVLLAGAALGWRRGALSQAVYWVAGIFMPVAWYAGDDSGSSVHAGWKLATGTTAGYLAGFILAAALVGYLAERKQDRDFATSAPASSSLSVSPTRKGVSPNEIAFCSPSPVGETGMLRKCASHTTPQA